MKPRSKSESDRIVREAINGYGFTEVEQHINGTYCTGCGQTHKRPVKMYTDGVHVLCKYQLENYWNPEEV